MSRTAQEGPSIVAGLFRPEVAVGFGPSRFHPAGHVPGGGRAVGRIPSRIKLGVKARAPRRPGVYAMFDRHGRVLYVGKAKNLRVRLLSYFRTESRDPKAGRILKYTRLLAWEHAAHEFAALLRELELIQRHRPRFNVYGLPGRQSYFHLVLGPGPAPHAYLTKSLTGKETAVYGPFVGRDRAGEAIRRLNDVFRLRDCPRTIPLHFADQGELFAADRGPKCLRYELTTCLGPCAGLCSRRGYGATVRAARAFLDGADRAVLTGLTTEMQTAAAALNYERASAVRDKLADLIWLDDRLSLLRRARDQRSMVYPLVDPDGRGQWLLVHCGQVRATVPEPVCPASRAAALAVMRKTFAESAAAVLGDKAVDSVLLVAAWFRKYPAEKEKLLPSEVAMNRCRAAG
jgi:excinuclease ABC subunit C